MPEWGITSRNRLKRDPGELQALWPRDKRTETGGLIAVSPSRWNSRVTVVEWEPARGGVPPRPR